MHDEPVSSAYDHGRVPSASIAHSASPSGRRSDSTQSSARSTVGHRWSRNPRSHVQRQWCQTPVAM